MIRHYLKITLRDFLKNKLRYTLTTLGIGVGIAIFAMVYFVSDLPSRMMDFPDENNLYQVVSSTERADGSFFFNFPYSEEVELDKVTEEPLPEIEQFAIINSLAIDAYTVNEENENIVFQTKHNYVNRDFFDLFSTEFVLGDAEKWGNGQNVVITETLAKKLFADEYPIGKRILIHNSRANYGNYIVVGVIKTVYTNTLFMSELFLELESELEQTYPYYDSYARLKEGSSLNDVNQILKTRTKSKSFKISNLPEGGSGFIKLVDIDEKEEAIPPIVRSVILVLGAIVLILALFNFFNLLLISVQARVRQFTLRKVLGADRNTLLIMLLCEIIPILLVAILISYSLIELMVEWIRSSPYSNTQIYGDISLLLSTVRLYPLITAGLTLLICIIVAILLTNRIQKIVLVQGIRGKIVKSHRHLSRNLMIFFQMLFTLIFLSCAMGISRSTMGFLTYPTETFTMEQSKGVFQINFHDTYNLSDKGDELLSRAKQLPGVEMAILGSSIMGYSSMNVRLRDYSKLVNSSSYFEGYEEFYNIKSTISAKYIGRDEVIVNQIFADLLREQEESSVRLMNEHVFKIAGTIPTIPYSEKNEPAMLYWLNPEELHYVLVKCTPESAQDVKTQLMKIIREYVPETLPYTIPSLYELFKQKNSGVYSVMTAFSIAALMSLILTLLGIFTAVNADVKRRRKEIAIRKINGATYRDVLWQYLKLYTILLLSVFILTIPIIMLILSTMKLEVSAVPIVFASWLFLATFSLLTVFKQIHRAANENPAEVVKTE